MNARQGFLLIAGFSGSAATLLLYLALFFVQIANADDSCESPWATVPGIDVDDLRGIGFENSFLNLGGRCRYFMEDGSVVVTREPGWWFSGTIASLVAALSGIAVLLTRRRGHRGVLYGLTTLLAPPLGLAMVAVAWAAFPGSASATRTGADGRP